MTHDPPLTNEELADELFLSAISRFPTPHEKQVAVAQLEKYRDAGAEDLLWALFNKLDFIFNY